MFEVVVIGILVNVAAKDFASNRGSGTIGFNATTKNLDSGFFSNGTADDVGDAPVTCVGIFDAIAKGRILVLAFRQFPVWDTVGVCRPDSASHAEFGTDFGIWNLNFGVFESMGFAWVVFSFWIEAEIRVERV